MFRLPADRALLNRMGFNNLGAGALAMRLARQRPEVPIGVNIGKTKATPADQAVDDYRASARLVGPLASYLVVNVSSPNTPGCVTCRRSSRCGPSCRPCSPRRPHRCW